MNLVVSRMESKSGIHAVKNPFFTTVTFVVVNEEQQSLTTADGIAYCGKLNLINYANADNENYRMNFA
ncbi:hypothetical protein T05_6387 [Trichinella murrelli]|uniref:Uncharacterized protein n=1 Tax=Trichinella murrelli TaxID=144512 RepID=A0A0V0TK69_9BILA|nr:hypothetical protein T05_6387 [Trichinella murrelli]